MTTTQRRLVFGCMCLLLLASVRTYAGGPLILRAPGRPFLWPNGGWNIPFNPAIFSTLYPEPSFNASTGTIEGAFSGPTTRLDSPA